MHFDWLSVLLALDLIYFPVIALWAAWQVLKLRRERVVRDEGGDSLGRLERELAELQHVVEAGRHRDAELEERFDTLYTRLRERLDSLELQAQAGGVHSQALKLLQSGMSPDELASVCGLTRGEADLLKALHDAGQQRVAAGGEG
jgi:hypothetical protein